LNFYSTFSSLLTILSLNMKKKNQLQRPFKRFTNKF
jgi:hypothetical protein